MSSRIWLVLACVYGIVNLIVFGMYALDKKKAEDGKWRTPESKLISAAIVGIIGALLGMVVCHHKTRKLKFAVGLPIIFFTEVIMVTMVYVKFILPK